MTIIFYLALSVLMSWLLQSFNPVKVSVSILVLSILMFLFMQIYTGQSWIPILLLLLFMGGIIMMFLILSSILPNEKTSKIKNLFLATIPMFFLGFVTNLCFFNEKMSIEMKSFFSSSMNFMFMTTLILIYFIIIMSMLSIQDTPMRSVKCYQSN